MSDQFVDLYNVILKISTKLIEEKNIKKFNHEIKTKLISKSKYQKPMFFKKNSSLLKKNNLYFLHKQNNMTKGGEENIKEENIKEENIKEENIKEEEPIIIVL